ncbi:hypothetical protein HYY75_03205 [bacterium]|nr:hypothetical protein [bacterium]
MTTYFRFGVTFLEVVIALFLFSATMGIVVQGANYFTRRMIQDRERQLGRFLAQKKLAEIESLPIKEGTFSGIFNEDNPDFRYSSRITRVPFRQVPVPNLFLVHLVVEWETSFSHDFFSLKTYVLGRSEI